MSVLCVLSHGGNEAGKDFIYGADGGKVFIDDILMSLDNIHCVKMAGKPKLFIMQACRGSK